MKHIKFQAASRGVAAALAVCGLCIGAIAQDNAPIKAEYSLVYPDGSKLKERPSEVRIVTPAQMQKLVGAKVGLAVLLFAATGGTSMSSGSKHDLNGSEIELPTDRSNLQIPDPDAFAARLGAKVNEAITSDGVSVAKPISRPLTLAGGAAHLVYESLSGEEAELYRLTTDWVVYLRKESRFSLSGPFVFTVNCASSSDKARSQKEWAENGYAQVKSELDAGVQACEKKVLEVAPPLLKG